VQLSIGRNAEGEYEVKRETIRGREQDAIDLLTRWNVQYLDHQITTTNYETVRQAYLVQYFFFKNRHKKKPRISPGPKI